MSNDNEKPDTGGSANPFQAANSAASTQNMSGDGTSRCQLCFKKSVPESMFDMGFGGGGKDPKNVRMCGACMDAVQRLFVLLGWTGPGSEGA